MYFCFSEQDDLAVAEEEDAKFSLRRMTVPILRAIQMVALILLILTAFYFGGLAQINSGIFASVFVTGVVFTIIIFYFKYGQKISKMDALGTILVVLCVLLIGFGGAIAL